MKLKAIFFVLICAVLPGCTSDSANEVTPNDPLTGLPNKGPIQLDNPVIGQRSSYVYFTATRKDETVNFSYPGDTLIVGITGFESNQWVIKEFLGEGSVSKKNKSTSGSGSWKGYADSVFVSNMKIDADSIYVTRPKTRAYNSFAFAGRNWAFQILQVADTEPSNATCSPAFRYDSHVWMEYSKNYTQHGKTFDRLNIHYDYRDMATDGFGFMYAYNLPNSFVRISWISYWELNKADGWDLISK